MSHSQNRRSTTFLNKFNHRKAPGEDTLTSEILRQTFKLFPNTFTEIYNKCLRRGHFPKQWKTAVIIPLIKPGKEETNDAQKYRPISLLNTGGQGVRESFNRQN